jgi:hypothetical protein
MICLQKARSLGIGWYTIFIVSPCLFTCRVSDNDAIARLVLNFKNIPFETVWLEYPDVEPTLKPLLVPSQMSLSLLPSLIFRPIV